MADDAPQAVEPGYITDIRLAGVHENGSEVLLELVDLFDAVTTVTVPYHVSESFVGVLQHGINQMLERQSPPIVFAGYPMPTGALVDWRVLQSKLGAAIMLRATLEPDNPRTPPYTFAFAATPDNLDILARVLSDAATTARQWSNPS